MVWGSSRTSLPLASPRHLCWEPRSLCLAGLQQLPASHRMAVGAALGAASTLWGQMHRNGTCCGGTSAGLHVLGDRGRDLQVPWDGSGLGSAAAQAALAWKAVPAAGCGAPACSRRSSLDSCNVSLACLSFHGVSILQPPSVLIPGGRGWGCLPWHRVAGAGIQAVLGMPEFYMQQQF